MDRRIPAGLSHQDTAIEFFQLDGGVRVLYRGSILPIEQLPKDVVDVIMEEIRSDKHLLRSLKKWGKTTEAAMITTFISCRYGGLDNTPDFDNGLKEPEYVPCGSRGTCPFEGVVCKNIRVANGFITSREVEVLKLVYLGFITKEISQKLGISRFTVENHIRNLKKKCDVSTNTDLVRIASEKRIIPYERLEESPTHTAAG